MSSCGQSPFAPLPQAARARAASPRRRMPLVFRMRLAPSILEEEPPTGLRPVVARGEAVAEGLRLGLERQAHLERGRDRPPHGAVVVAALVPHEALALQ